MNRPEKKNSLSIELVNILLKTLEDVAADEQVRAIVIRGAGDKAFCSGFDIRSLPTNHCESAKDELKRLKPVEGLFNAVINFPWKLPPMRPWP
ncbi:MAG: enoyl-CoA hydratase/isomerase family protein [bacterium]|nr:enoyl-CoA hydratase/isomerase family protein [bacterium]